MFISELGIFAAELMLGKALYKYEEYAKHGVILLSCEAQFFIKSCLQRCVVQQCSSYPFSSIVILATARNMAHLMMFILGKESEVITQLWI